MDDLEEGQLFSSPTIVGWSMEDQSFLADVI